MKQLLNCFRSVIALWAMLLCSCEKSDSPPIHRMWGSQDIVGQERTYLLNLPDTYEEGDSFPLVVALHGTGGSAEQCERDYGLSTKADMLGYVIVYPEGIPRPGPFKIRTWNAGKCCDYSMEQGADDVKFIRTLIQGLTKKFKVDPDRVFVTGMSNGAMMAYRLACELPGRIRAIAPVSGTLMTESPCEPSESMPVLHIHSELDEIIPYRGGVGLGGYYFHPVDSTLQVMAEINECPISPQTFEEHDDYVHRQWSCQDDIIMESYITKDGGHSWPGGKKPRSGADEPSKAIDATELVFDFFGRYN